MFKGYFENADYTNPNIFLQCGKQTEFIFDEASKIEISINSEQDLYKIIDFIKQNLQSVINNKDKFSKTAKEIWARGTYSGCSDFALVFETISRQLKIPTVHLQMADIEWIKQISNGVTPPIVRGHNTCECYINNRWVYVDPINRKINFEYDKNNLKISDKYMVFAKSIDIFETGINCLEKNNAVMQNIFKTRHLI